MRPIYLGLLHSTGRLVYSLVPVQANKLGITRVNNQMHKIGFMELLLLSVAVLRHLFASTLARVKVLCPTTRSHCLNKCWLIIDGFRGTHPRTIFSESVQNINSFEIERYTCYLPKFSILASMFVWRFVTCQNFQFWQVCSFVRLFVCLFVCYRRDTGRTVWPINTKLGTTMEPVCGMSCILFGVDDVTDDVISSKSRSYFEIVITPSFFELERRTKAQNIGISMAYIDVGINFRYKFRFERSPGPQNGGHFENFEIF